MDDLAFVKGFAPLSKVWIYPANRFLTTEEWSLVDPALKSFTSTWTAHNQKLKAHAWIRDLRFLILVVDEKQAGVSGCSIDASVRFLKDLGDKFDVDFFDRNQLFYRNQSGHIDSLSISELPNACAAGIITLETRFINTLASDLEQLKNAWELPLKDSWQKRFL